MPDAFFSKSNATKRKRPSTAANPTKKNATARPAPSSASSKSKTKRDEELSDDGGEDVGLDDMDLRRDTRGGESDDEERVRSQRETAGEKRLRMAREYLEGIEKEQGQYACSVSGLSTLIIDHWPTHP